jgi:hypothetical protein
MSTNRPEITKIKMTSNRLASGKAVYKGKIYKVPADVSLEDAVTLCVCGHAQDLTGEKDKPETDPKKAVGGK